MIAPDIILKSNRKTLSLCIMKDGRVVVRVPTRAKQCDIDRFILEKQGWLAQKLALIQNIKTTFDDVSSYQKLLYLGERYTLKRGRVRGVVIGDDFSIIIPEKLDNAKILSSIKKWYKKEAKAILEKRTQEISNKIKLFASEIKINDSKGRWGACNSKNVITYNWRVVMLPPAIIDYVIVHELCHLVEFNHSQKFWSLVQTFLTDAKTRRNKIKDYSFLLGMFKEK